MENATRIITDAERIGCTFLGLVSPSNYRLSLWVGEIVDTPDYQQWYESFVADPEGLARLVTEVDGGAAPEADYLNALLTEEQIRNPATDGVPELDRELYELALSIVMARRRGTEEYSGTVGTLFTYEGSLAADVARHTARIGMLLQDVYATGE